MVVFLSLIEFETYDHLTTMIPIVPFKIESVYTELWYWIIRWIKNDHEHYGVHVMVNELVGERNSH